jgi:AcrR family transcriptional regulator
MSSDEAQDDLHEFRAMLGRWLRERSAAIEEAIFARVRAMSDLGGEMPTDYADGLRAAVAESVSFGLTCIERGEAWSGSIPPAVSAQARLAARSGVSLETVLRRYKAGDRLLREFIIDGADQRSSRALRRILSAQTAQFDRLVGLVATEYMREQDQMTRSPDRRLTDRVQQMLAGIDLGDQHGLAYELSAWHTGLVALGTEAEEAARELATGLDRQILVVPQEDGVLWAWLGGRRELRVAEVERHFLAVERKHASISIGEPRRGIEGWRLTHHEARAGLEVMLRRPQRSARGSDALLLAAVLGNETLIESLLQTYLTPLDHVGDAGGTLRETLRAYFDADCNTVAAAAALDVNRHTVRRRLQKVEDALGRLLPVCHSELDVALRLEELQISPVVAGLRVPRESR